MTKPILQIVTDCIKLFVINNKLLVKLSADSAKLIALNAIVITTIKFNLG